MGVRAWLTVAIAALAIALTGCNGVGRTGNVSLRVTVLSDASVSVSRVDYRVTGRNLGELAGAIQLAQPATVFSKLVSHVPAGKGYQLSVKATSRDGKFTCEGTAVFDVKANATTQVNLGIGCHEGGGDGGEGKVVISIGIVCPAFRILSWTISPLMATVGGTITVSANAPPLASGAPASYRWSASGGGAFADPQAASTVYTCTTPGAYTLSVTASNDVCRDTQSVPITCVADGGVGDDDPDAI
jgi:hypothetical protein